MVPEWVQAAKVVVQRECEEPYSPWGNRCIKEESKKLLKAFDVYRFVGADISYIIEDKRRT